jgi:sulfur carrier protein
MIGMQNAIKIHVNGEARTCRSGATVAELLSELDVKTDRVAVELNLEILDRAAFGHRRIADGDRVEIMSFIGGGSSSRGQHGS